MEVATPVLEADFFEQVEKMGAPGLKVRWYYCVIVNLGAVNYPDVIPQVWDHCWKHVCEPLSHEERFKVAQKLREALIKACGIMGPAKYVKTGVAIRTLGKCIPQELWDSEMRRAKESQETASKRGYALHKKIYGRNPDFDSNATPAASPDYAFVVRDLLYGRVLSFDAILDDLETGYVIVSTLIGIDCQYQLKNHMKGMLYNGATREQLYDLRDLCLDLARRLGVTFRDGPRPIPSVDEGQNVEEEQALDEKRRGVGLHRARTWLDRQSRRIST